MAKEVPALLGSEEITDVADGLPKGLDGPGSSFAQQLLEFGEGQFDRIEVWRIGRQEERPGAAILNELCNTRSFVRGQIVHDDDIALRKRGSELRLDIRLKRAAVHRTVEYPRCRQAVTSQAGDEGLGVPMAERHMHSQALADGCPSPQPSHLRCRTGLVDKDQTMGFNAHARLAQPDPLVTLLRDVGTILLAGQQCFF